MQAEQSTTAFGRWDSWVARTFYNLFMGGLKRALSNPNKSGMNHEFASSKINWSACMGLLDVLKEDIPSFKATVWHMHRRIAWGHPIFAIQCHACCEEPGALKKEISNVELTIKPRDLDTWDLGTCDRIFQDRLYYMHTQNYIRARIAYTRIPAHTQAKTYILHAYMHTCIHTLHYTHTNIHTLHGRLHALHTYICTHARKHDIHTYIACMHACMHTLHACMPACMHCIHACLPACMYA